MNKDFKKPGLNTTQTDLFPLAAIFSFFELITRGITGSGLNLLKFMGRSNFNFNFAEKPLIKQIIKNPLFPYVFQICALLVFILLVINGLMTGSPAQYGHDLTKIIRKTNITTLAVWGLWWPGLILATIFFGRIWCTVCPMELISNLFNKAAKILKLKPVKLHKLFSDGIIALALYLILQLLVAGFEVHRVPVYTSYVLIGLLLTAAFVGIAFKSPRTFCKSFCPATLLLKAYSMFTPLLLRKNIEVICENCNTKECAPGCPGYLKPSDLNRNDDCVNCFRCAKACAKENIGFGFISGFYKEKLIEKISFPLALFVFVASGFVSHDLFSESEYADKFFHFIPQLLANMFNQPDLFQWFEGLWFLLIMPMLVVSLIWSVSLFYKTRHKFSEIISKIALFLIPILATGHATKAIIKMNTWSSYLPNALVDTRGIETAQNIITGIIKHPVPIASEVFIFPVLLVMILSVAIISIMLVNKKLEHGIRQPAYAGIALLSGLYFLVTLNIFYNFM